MGSSKTDDAVVDQKHDRRGRELFAHRGALEPVSAEVPCLLKHQPHRPTAQQVSPSPITKSGPENLMIGRTKPT
jgi:hypothetical protein